MFPVRARWLLAVVIAGSMIAGLAGRADAVPLNEEGTINVSVRAYVNARIGTNSKQSTRTGCSGAECATPLASPPSSFGGTFVYSGAGHLMQNRYFLDVEWDHDILPMFDDILPDWVSSLEYTLGYRGEYEGIYDFGPSEFSKSEETYNELQSFLRQGPTFQPGQIDQLGDMTYFVRHRLRQVATYRNRLFQAFVDVELGDLFIRAGRQNLVWGETDVFRLLDNINPIDNSFGGFFIDLDERRVPLNMIRSSYYLGSIGGVLDQAFIEGYVAYDNTVAFIPGAPAGSPWSTPLGPFTGRTLQEMKAPSPGDVRGGGRAVFNVSDFTFTLASYFTSMDIQAVRFRAACGGNETVGTCEGRPRDIGFQNGVSIITAEQTAPRVWVNGAAMTTALPDLMAVLRSEVAWFRDEAFFSGPGRDSFPGTASTTDPNYLTNFLGPVLAGTHDTLARKDTIKAVLGWDMNQYISMLNPSQSFFFSTQFFYRHMFDHEPCGVDEQGMGKPCSTVSVPTPNNSTRVVQVPEDQFLHTLLINTTYNMRIPFTESTVQATPGFGMFYDWQGMMVFQPSLRFVRDPWRVIVDYTNINSGVFKQTFGIVRDRDNVRLQLEYVL
ncbi:MAG: hypothetical protein P8R42_27720 [Candidatus Binatia bacterium]|nr:hypothetical protein [Candidatus Binatia bacterium]